MNMEESFPFLKKLCGGVYTPYMWKSEDNLLEPVLSFHNGVSRDQTQAAGFMARAFTLPIESSCWTTGTFLLVSSQLLSGTILYFQLNKILICYRHEKRPQQKNVYLEQVNKAQLTAD